MLITKQELKKRNMLAIIYYTECNRDTMKYINYLQNAITRRMLARNSHRVAIKSATNISEGPSSPEEIAL